MKKGGMTMKPAKYQEGGRVRQGMQSPAASRARSDEAEATMRRERAAEPISKMEERRGREEDYRTPGLRDDIEKMLDRQRRGFKKGGKIPAPKKMQAGGMTAMPRGRMTSNTPMRAPGVGGPSGGKPAGMMPGGGRPGMSPRPISRLPVPAGNDQVSIMPVNAMRKGGKVAMKQGKK